MIKNLFCPVNVYSQEVIDWAFENDLLDQPDEIPTLTGNISLVNSLNASIEKNRAFPGIRDEFYEGEAIREKVNSLVPAFELQGDSIWLKIICEINQQIGKEELDILKQYVAKQVDAWGSHGIQAEYEPYSLIIACVNVADLYPSTKAEDLYVNSNFLYEDEMKKA